jgi:hypothetical protein
VSSDNGPNGVNQPTARHSGNIANNTASGHAKGRHCLTGAAKTPPNQQGSSGARAVAPPLTVHPLASAHFRRLPPPLPCRRHGPG